MHRTLARWLSLEGQVVLITDGGTGLGSGFATAFAAAGARVVVGGRRRERLEETVVAVSEQGGTAMAVEADVRVPADCDAAVEAALSAFGRLDVLVNNAAVNQLVSALDSEPAGFRDVIDTNLTGPFTMAQAAARVMEPGSSIVNIATARPTPPT